MQVRPAGDRAVLIEFEDEDLRLEAMKLPGLTITGHSSLLHFPAIPKPPAAALQPVTHHIPVLFERDPREVTLRARYLGFRAGFAYLEGWPDPLPRLATSRPVARGSFAVAGTMAGFYPIDTPGGWNILGRTNVNLWDPNREQPNLIAAGDVVHVIPVDALPPAEPLMPAAEPEGEVIAEVISPGQLTRIVGPRDWSRVRSGLAPGGPFDEAAAAAANRAVGNADDAAVLECVLVAPALRLNRRAAMWDDGKVGQLVDGRMKSFRGYIAIEGGIAVRSNLEEAERVTRGMPLYVGRVLNPPPPRRVGEPAPHSDQKRIAIAPGPHEPSIREVECVVTPQLDRVGIRLRPLRDLGIDAPRDLRSCGMQFGSVQLHPDGSLVVMGPDHPVTGGYLQPMTVLSTELWKLAQLAPGERVTFYSP